MHHRQRVLFGALRALSLATLVAATSSAHAQTGVSDDRVSLPEGPGSIGGIGRNAMVGGNLGAFTTSVPFELPAGQRGTGPELGLSYDSMAGASVAGIGFAFDVPSIERSTLRGLPRYDADDLIAADRSGELVRVASSGADATYRARFEAGFVRTTWRDAGAAGSFTSELPDGSVRWFGADAAGALVPEATLHDDQGRVFRWYLVDEVDPWGHKIHYSYRATAGGAVVPARVEWGYGHDGQPLFAAVMRYEARADVVSSCLPGFEERLDERLVEVAISARGHAVRSYRLVYEDDGASAGLSRLLRVERRGSDGSLYPVVPTFAYSRALGGVCEEASCAKPFVVDMGSLSGGVSFTTGAATLVDLDGDSLPDLVDGSQTGPFRVWMNALGDDGQGHFAPAAQASATATRSEFPLGTASVQVLDLDGNGLADLINAATGRALCNTGSGDFTRDCTLGDVGVPLTADVGDADPDPAGVRFMDVDGDRRIDVVRTAAGKLSIRRRTADGFESMAGDDIGVDFDTERLDLADMNGDGLQDIVEIQDDGTLRYRLAYGRGRMSGWIGATFSGLDRSEVPSIELEDVNGDGLSDVVVVVGSSVRYAVNESAGRFRPLVTLGAGDVDGVIPTRGATTTVLFADMNGNGTDDIVWVEPSGAIRYLEVTPVRPNLVARVDNGIGAVTRVRYGTSISHRSAAWHHLMPTAVQVVDELDSYVTVTGRDDGSGIHEIERFGYEDGFYDAAERQFRGFAETTVDEIGDDGTEPSRTTRRWDLGDADAYRAGRLLVESIAASGDHARPLQETRNSYADCPLAEVPSGLPIAVRFVCPTAIDVIHQEGAEPGGWLTTRSEMDHDGYGNVAELRQLGVVHRGPPEAPAACDACPSDGSDVGPCGASCDGDELVTATTFVTPGVASGGRWILGAVQAERRYAGDGSVAAETRTFYDGPDYQGLPAGQLTRGAVVRVEADVAPGQVVELERRALDAHGNEVRRLDPLGTPTGHGHAEVTDWDADGLHPVRSASELATPEDGAPYLLARETSYDPTFDEPAAVTREFVVGDGLAADEAPTTFEYDKFGRVSAIYRPGDAAGQPTRSFDYELTAPVSRVVTTTHGAGEGGRDELVAARCMDGLGREVEERTRIGAGAVFVSGFVARDSHGEAVRVYDARTVNDLACATAEPSGVPVTRLEHDGLGRISARILPDAALHGGEATARTYLHGPLQLVERTTGSGASPSATTTLVDGLGRTLVVGRDGDDGQASLVRVAWDDLGRIAGYRDALGNVKTQRWDLLDRLVAIDDPQTGLTTTEYDDAGNVVAVSDARGVTERRAYDGKNRLVARWDDADRQGSEVRFRWDLASQCPDCTNGSGHVVEVDAPLPAAVAALLGQGSIHDERAYDARDRLTRESRRFGADLTFDVDHSFDGADRELATRYAGLDALTRSFDGDDRLVAVAHLGPLATVAWDERGLLHEVDHADGSADSFAWDARGDLARVSTFDASGRAALDRTLTRNRDAAIVAIADGRELDTGAADETAVAEVDGWNRLTALTLGEGDQAEHLTWDLDDDGVARAATSDRSGSPAHLGPIHASRVGLVDAVAGHQKSYDAAGFVTARDGQALAWNARGQLTRIGTARGEEALGYDGDGKLAAVAVDDGLELKVAPGFDVVDGVGVVHVKVGGRLVARVEHPELAAEVYSDLVPDGRIDAADAWLAQRGATGATPPRTLLRASARALIVEARGQVTHLHADGLGSVVLATRDGAVVGARSFTPHGAVRAERGFVDGWGFTGQEHDDASGLVWFAHRAFDPTTQTWLSSDPQFAAFDARALGALGDALGRQVYVGGAPLDHVDPDGLTRRLMLRISGRGQTMGGASRPAHEPNERVASNGNQVRESLARRVVGGLNRSLRGLRAPATPPPPELPLGHEVVHIMQQRAHAPEQRPARGLAGLLRSTQRAR